MPLTMIESVPVQRAAGQVERGDGRRPTPCLKLSVPPLTEMLLSVGRVVPAPTVTVPLLTETTGPQACRPCRTSTDPPLAVEAAGGVVCCGRGRASAFPEARVTAPVVPVPPSVPEPVYLVSCSARIERARRRDADQGRCRCPRRLSVSVPELISTAPLLTSAV